MRKVSSARGLEIIHQGAQQFMALWEEFNCPFDERKKPVERKLWFKGWHEAKIKWFKPIEARRRFKKPFQKRIA
jgi:ribosome modulation factor